MDTTEEEKDAPWPKKELLGLLKESKFLQKTIFCN